MNIIPRFIRDIFESKSVSVNRTSSEAKDREKRVKEIGAERLSLDPTLGKGVPESFERKRLIDRVCEWRIVKAISSLFRKIFPRTEPLAREEGIGRFGNLLSAQNTMIAAGKQRRSVPDDGNCLYHSISKLLEQKNIIVSQGDLRRQAVEMMKELYEGDETLRGLVDAAIHEHNRAMDEKIETNKMAYDFLKQEGELSEADYRAKLDEDVARYLKVPRIGSDQYAINQYYDIAADDGFWASSAEIYALGMKYAIQFHVHSGDFVQTLPPERYSDNTADIAFSQGNHYEPIY